MTAKMAASPDRASGREVPARRAPGLAVAGAVPGLCPWTGRRYVHESLMLPEDEWARDPRHLDPSWAVAIRHLGVVVVARVMFLPLASSDPAAAN